MIGYQEIIIILILALLVFGPQKLPEIGRQVGGALRELRKMSSDMQRALDLDDSGGYDRYDYDRDRYNRDYNAGSSIGSSVSDTTPQLEAYDGGDAAAAASSSFAYSAPEGETYAQGSLTAGDTGEETPSALPAPPGPPAWAGDSVGSDLERETVPSAPSPTAEVAAEQTNHSHSATAVMSAEDDRETVPAPAATASAATSSSSAPTAVAGDFKES
jgi:Sec-independent protein secretion pathway components